MVKLTLTTFLDSSAHQYLPEIVINSFESILFPWQRPSSENRFQIHPLPLDLVQIVHVLIQVCKTRLPDGGFIRKASIIRRVLQRLKETLIVANLK